MYTKLFIYLLLIFALSITVSYAQPVIVPVGGNTWSAVKSSRTLSNKGITNWNNNEEYFTTYVRTNTTGSLTISVKGNSPQGSSVISVSINGVSKNITIKSNESVDYNAGTWQINDTGYIAIKIGAISKSHQCFPNIEALTLSGSAISGQVGFVENNEGDFFYWGRRGPSTHMSYALDTAIKAEWFYNEITVPPGSDVTGSYFMANGFAEGYFGIQVNSATERRVLFSVWSPYHTDNPKDIPDDYKIELLKKGESVHTGEFGNEGSGGQSFMRYHWKTGNTYKFLLQGKPDGASHTVYTAYFFAPEQKRWMLIASFRRPLTVTYLRRLHSFLENFIPEYGDISRKVYLGNQWVRDASCQWHQLTKGRFTADNTARVGFRKDYAGGVDGNRFFLNNFGFFNTYTIINSRFDRIPDIQPPAIDFDTLP